VNGSVKGVRKNYTSAIGLGIFTNISMLKLSFRVKEDSLSASLLQPQPTLNSISFSTFGPKERSFMAMYSSLVLFNIDPLVDLLIAYLPYDGKVRQLILTLCYRPRCLLRPPPRTEGNCRPGEERNARYE